MRRWTPLLLLLLLWVVAAAPLLAPGDHDHDHDHAAGDDDDCGVDAQALSLQLDEARARAQGARLTLDASALAIAGEVNVGLAPDVDPADLARRHGLTLVRALPALGLATLAGDASPARCAALGATRGVRFAEPNWAARTAGDGDADPLQRLQRGWAHARLEAAWELTTGDPSILVAVLDTGCDPAHAALEGRVVAGWDFVNGDASPDDDSGHGTAVTGIIVANRGDGLGIAGVAPDARVLSIKVADGLGVASVANVAAGIDLAIARGARVINVSLGARVPSRALAQAIERALAAGLVVVAAAGNDPVHHLVYPAACPGVLAVTALGDGDELAWSTSLACDVALGAPGEQVATTYPGGLHGFISGSSAAAAFASGVAALTLARDPSLSGAEVARTLRAAQAPLPALAGHERFYRFGRLDARAAVERASRVHAELALVGLEVVPVRPRPGQPARVRVEVENRGHAPVVTRVDVTTVGGAPLSLAPGERRVLELAWTPSQAGDVLLEARVVGGDLSRALAVVVDPTPSTALRVAERTLGALEPGARALPFAVTIENVGSAPAAPVVEARVGDAPLGRVALPSLAPGERATATFIWTLPAVAPRGVVTLEAVARAGDATAATRFDAIIDGTQLLGDLYQQSNGVDVILDAPWRIAPGRDRVPVLLFAASKGGLGLSTTTLRIDRAVLTVKDAAAATTGTTVYEFVRGQPLSAPAGHEVVDELGRPRASLVPFEGQDLAANGRHEVHRLPRASFGVPLQPASSGVHRFLDAKVEWTYRMPLPLGLTVTRAGSHRSVLRVGFAREALPRLPGEGHHHDVHNHTIAEWYFTSPLNVFAPRKAYGGPIVMLREAAHALGVLDSPADVRDLVITTDHNNFYNMTTPDPVSPDHWPPFGEQGLAQHPRGTTKLEAYRRIFGDAAGEEVAFKQDVTTRVNLPASVGGGTANVTLPLGAHLLLMSADHQEGAWNGGGWIAGPGNVGPDVPLDAALARAAQQSAPGRAAFAYAAHPFGGMGWSDPHVERSFGLAPADRTLAHVDRARQQFVLKGLQFWNGRSTRTLDPSTIDFNDLNPWADPVFAAGRSNWDGGLQGSLRRWHDVLATNLEYAFVHDPETRFIRKVFAAAGSDAHGDFNFGVSRMATPVSVNATYHCSNDPWYAPTTYCLADGRLGATPAQRALQAYADGATLMSDGPLVTFALDAEAHLDGADLRWHAAALHQDDDGRIGGGGAFDGLGTALVRRGSSDVTYRYRYTNSADFGSNDGQVVAVKLYRTEAGAPNPAAGGRLTGLADFPTAGEDQDHVRALGSEGPITRPSALMLGAYTGVDPDAGTLGPDEHRCYTNPIFAVPFDAQATVAQVDLVGGVIPAGGLAVELTFDITMEPSGTISLKPLDARGDSTGRATPALMTLTPTWVDRPGIKTSTLRLTNAAPIPLQGEAYPAPDRCGFVVVFEDPRDAFGNALNSVAVTFDAPRVAQPTGSTAAAATAAPGARVRAAGGSSGGGCSLATDRAPAGPWAVVLLLVFAFAARATAGVRSFSDSAGAARAPLNLGDRPPSRRESPCTCRRGARARPTGRSALVL